MVTITSPRPRPAAARLHPRSGGIFRDMTIHDFDVARWLLGEEVETVRPRPRC
jgi:myo-inositol 2-dehydrogenase / D-chiro-inositol 1-dehydrogenase